MEHESNPVSGSDLLLKLYIAGMTPTAKTAISNLEKLCRENIPEGEYAIEVIDLLERPQLAADEQIFAVPTLMRELPLPIQKIIGDLSDSDRVLVGLDLKKRG